MTLIPRLKSWSKYTWLGIAFFATLAVASIAVLLSRRRGKPAQDIIDDANERLTEIAERISEANHQAAIEVAVARTKDLVARQDLKEALQEKDSHKRRRALVELRYRVNP